MWLTGVSPVLFFVCCIFQAAAWSIKIYQVKDGVVSTKPTYTTLSYKRLVSRKDFSENDVVHLVVANPTDACTTKVKQPPELLVASSAVPKWILLMDSEPCADGLLPKIHHALQKGYDGVIMYSLQPNQDGRHSSPVQIPPHIEDSIHINVDLVGYNDGMELKKFEFRVRSSSGRYLLRYSTFGQKAHVAKETGQGAKQNQKPTHDQRPPRKSSVLSEKQSPLDDWGLRYDPPVIVGLVLAAAGLLSWLSYCMRRTRVLLRYRGNTNVNVAIRDRSEFRGLYFDMKRHRDVCLPQFYKIVSAESLQMDFISTIAQGAFGVVCEMFIRLPRAKNCSTHIALKRAHTARMAAASNAWISTPDSSLLDSTTLTPAACLAQEIEILRAVPHHDNVVTMVGFGTNKTYMMMEFCGSGDLATMVRCGTYSQRALMDYMKGVAQGIHHLHSNNVIHRDLAARNILIHKGVSKIADFGTALQLAPGTLFHQERGGVMWAIQWLAPEAFRGMYSTHSDVWAFGILFWEVFCGGQAPYADMNIQDTVALMERLAQEYRLPKPNGCSDDVYRLMLQCWTTEFQRRPSAQQLIDYLSNVL